MEIVLMIPRRGFFKTVALSTGAMAASSYNLVGASYRVTNGIIDTDVSLARRPFRRLPMDQTKQLVAKLKQAGVTEACAGSFDGLLHKNLGAVNDRLASECEGTGNH